MASPVSPVVELVGNVALDTKLALGASTPVAPFRAARPIIVEARHGAGRKVSVPSDTTTTRDRLLTPCCQERSAKIQRRE